MVVNIEVLRQEVSPAVMAPLERRRSPRTRVARSSGKCLRIGLLNNMAGAAFKATERQFLSLLDFASGGMPIQASFFVLPGLSSSEAGGQHFARHYSGVEALFDAQLDGLIVTGREPKTPSLRDEPYWESFTQVLEWARTNTISTVWSCLAAHAAVLHMDGIERRKSAEKNFGLFKSARTSPHMLFEDMPQSFAVPHSRWNGLPEADLVQRGYEVLSHTENGNVDTFVKQAQSLFVFFQGHYEYDTDTLMREYRRDVLRFIRHETSTHPGLPRNYFDGATESALLELRESAIAKQSTTIAHQVSELLATVTPENTWRNTAAGIYGNWLRYIAANKALSVEQHMSDQVAAARG